MSDNRVMHGYIGLLLNPVTGEVADEFNDKQYDCGWHISSDGRLLVQDRNRNMDRDRKLEPEHFIVVGMPNMGAERFREDAKMHGYPVGAVKPYMELSYDGCAASIHQMSGQDFLEGLNAHP